MTFQKLQLVYHVKTTNNFSKSLYKMAASLNFMKMRKKIGWVSKNIQI